MASAAPVRLDEPEERLFRIGEVSRLTGTKAFVLRYWEQEIPALQPVKTPTGHRLYRREDIDTVLEIKRLLYEDGFTLAGARKHLAEQRLPHAIASGEPGPDAEPVRALAQRPMRAQLAHQKVLLDLHEELLAILTLLKRE
jgi:DNA-binding transcriptional MerR regulator